MGALRLAFFMCIVFVVGLVHGQEQSLPLPSSPVSYSNENGASCATDIFLSKKRKDAKFIAAEDKMNRAILLRSQQVDTTAYTLPVVFHIIYQSPSSISDAQIVSALKDLNDAFGKTGPYAASAGADTKIRFCLAQKDPDGGLTNGITRTTHFFGTHLNPIIEDAKLKNLVMWDPSRYINIWLVESMELEIVPKFACGKWIRLRAGGYATMPPGGGPTDGIVVTGFGSLLVHEMGHYLGLYHTFEGLDCRNFDCTTDGDKVCDTPPDASVTSAASCTGPANSCSSDTLSGFTVDMPDPIRNFMDYGNEPCHNEFTEGQSVRMRAAIATQRSGLLQDECTPPCTETIVAGFTRNNPLPINGSTVTFTNTSSGAANYEWLIDGTVVGTLPNLTHTFTASGKYKVTLKAFNTPTCFGIYTDYVIVNCGVTARFYTDKAELASKAPIYLDSIRFTNNSENATSYQWLMANDAGMAEQVVSTAPNFTYVFTTPANYTVRLIAINGVCTDTTYLFPIRVIDPVPDGALYIYNAECFQETKVRLSVYVCDFGFAPLPKGLPISFYDGDPRIATSNKIGSTLLLPDTVLGQCCGYLITHTIDVGRKGLNQLWGVFNDNGTTRPLALPNTGFIERDYNNNIGFLQGFAFKVTATPPLSVLEWGDTIQLLAQARPSPVASYRWSTATNLSCSNCQSPQFIADTSTQKTVIATSILGCTDTAKIIVQVPPYNDFMLSINNVQCAKQDSIYINFTIRNSFKRAVIPKGLRVAFYNGDPLSAGTTLLPNLFIVPDTVRANQATYSIIVKGMPPGVMYGVVNDSARIIPIALPNTPFLEKNYSNNFVQFNYVRFGASAAPATATLEWGDTLQLNGYGGPDTVATFLWSSPRDISCTTCQFPLLIADSSIVKHLLVTSIRGCTDTTSVYINVPPYNDFAIRINDVQCSRGDSLFVNFTLTNFFKRGILPKTLSVSFYNGDPSTGSAILLGPVFSLPDTVRAKQFTFSTFIKGFASGRIYAVVNDSGRSVPVVLPTTHLLEKLYSNNIADTLYAPEKVRVQPSDTTIFRTTSLPLIIKTPIYNAASTLWSTGSTYSMSCILCPSPVVTVNNNSLVQVQTENRFGCVIKGTSNIKIFPPDMKVEILDTKCFTNNLAVVTFKVCMNNFYDSVFANIPVSFYDGDPLNGSSRLLTPVFRTPSKVAGGCITYITRITSPRTNQLFAVVNDRGDNRAVVPNKFYDETDYTNNVDTAVYTPFTININPADTTIPRLTNLTLTATPQGGTITSYAWSPAQFISCTDCAAPVITPPYTYQYQLFARNEHGCTDTSLAIIRTRTGGEIFIPDAFTPNADRLNDVLYVLAGPDVLRLDEFSIFNRWGQLIFTTQNVPANNPAFGWSGLIDGKEAPSGTYVYYVKVRLRNNEQQFVKGTVVLIR